MLPTSRRLALHRLRAHWQSMYSLMLARATLQRDPINRLIRELELPIADADAGLARVRQFVDRILANAEMKDGNLR